MEHSKEALLVVFCTDNEEMHLHTSQASVYAVLLLAYTFCFTIDVQPIVEAANENHQAFTWILLVD